VILPGLLYFITLALFGFVIFASMRIPNDIWLVACIFPAFIALILGFVMAVFAWGEYGPQVSVGSLVPPLLAVRLIRGKLSTRNLFLAISGAALVGLVFARVALLAADIG
jgi:hypothetical protein